MRGMGIDMYGSRESFLRLMDDIRGKFGTVFLEWRSLSPIKAVDDFPICEPFGLIGCVTWPEFLDSLSVEQRTLKDGRVFYFVTDNSFCFRASWFRSKFDAPSNCVIEYQRLYFRHMEVSEKPEVLTSKFMSVSRYVKRRLKRLSGGVYSLEDTAVR